MTTLHLRKSIGRSALRLGFTLIALALSFFALPQRTQAVSPAPDGGYPNGNTAEGANALLNLTSGPSNTAVGSGALYHNTTGGYSAAMGFEALFSNTSGSANTASGYQALYHNTGNSNTASGWLALFSNTTGTFNTANGANALHNNTTGYYNTANGVSALHTNTTGIYNTATGVFALDDNTIGHDNTANGFDALLSNTRGVDNTAMGSGALSTNSTGNYNTAVGFYALLSNTIGLQNTATGVNALISNTTGGYNTANGVNTLYHNTGSNNIGLGYGAGSSLTTGSGNICIGSGVLGVAGESNTTRIRNIYSSMASDRAVYVNSDNKIGTLVSSRRFKDEIKLMDKASEAILALKPVTFRYKKEIEPNGAIMFGLIAEEVEKVDPDLVTRNDKGEAETVRYEAVNAMLLNEFLKEHRKVEALQASFAQQEKDFRATVAQLTARLEEQDSKIEKVSAQVEVSRFAPRTVLNDQ